jgi:hypothetical protein
VHALPHAAVAHLITATTTDTIVVAGVVVIVVVVVVVVIVGSGSGAAVFIAAARCLVSHFVALVGGNVAPVAIIIIVVITIIITIIIVVVTTYTATAIAVSGLDVGYRHAQHVMTLGRVVEARGTRAVLVVVGLRVSGLDGAVRHQNSRRGGCLAAGAVAVVARCAALRAGARVHRPHLYAVDHHHGLLLRVLLLLARALGVPVVIAGPGGTLLNAVRLCSVI